MLDRLEDAFSRRQASEDRLRTFIADASHELRTPLASIRGYAELFRMGAVPEGPEQARASSTAPDREISLAANGGAPVLGDAHQLRQVLGNLLRNALVHTPAGTPIEVSVEPRPDVVRVTVRDHGPGLPTDDADAIFERFWRAEGGRERGKGGAGLGLAIVAGIVDAHDGRVRAGNADGGGAAFVVELPALRKL